MHHRQERHRAGMVDNEYETVKVFTKNESFRRRPAKQRSYYRSGMVDNEYETVKDFTKNESFRRRPAKQRSYYRSGMVDDEYEPVHVTTRTESFRRPKHHAAHVGGMDDEYEPVTVHVRNECHHRQKHQESSLQKFIGARPRTPVRERSYYGGGRKERRVRSTSNKSLARSTRTKKSTARSKKSTARPSANKSLARSTGGRSARTEKSTARSTKSTARPSAHKSLARSTGGGNKSLIKTKSTRSLEKQKLSKSLVKTPMLRNTAVETRAPADDVMPWSCGTRQETDFRDNEVPLVQRNEPSWACGAAEEQIDYLQDLQNSFTTFYKDEDDADTTVDESVPSQVFVPISPRERTRSGSSRLRPKFVRKRSSTRTLEPSSSTFTPHLQLEEEEPRAPISRSLSSSSRLSSSLSRLSCGTGMPDEFEDMPDEYAGIPDDYNVLKPSNSRSALLLRKSARMAGHGSVQEALTRSARMAGYRSAQEALSHARWNAANSEIEVTLNFCVLMDSYLSKSQCAHQEEESRAAGRFLCLPDAVSNNFSSDSSASGISEESSEGLAATRSRSFSSRVKQRIQRVRSGTPKYMI